MTLPVLILAGSRDGERDPLAQYGNVSHKALLPVVGIPMIEKVIQSLEAASGIGPIWVSIENPSCLNFLEERVHVLKAASSPSESVALALQSIGTPCLITTADHALLSPSWVHEFLEKSKSSGADITAAVASASSIKRDVPQTKRTFIKLSDLTFSGCNLFLCRTPQAENVISFWKNLQRNRKHPLRMAWTLGPLTLVRFALRCLSMHNLENRISYLTHARVKIIILDDGKSSIDIDKISDLHLVEKIIGNN